MTRKRTTQIASLCLAAVFTALTSAAKPPSYETQSFDGDTALPPAPARTEALIPEARAVPVDHSWNPWKSHIRLLDVEYTNSGGEFGNVIRVTLGEGDQVAGSVRIVENHHSFILKLGDVDLNMLFGGEMAAKNYNGFDISRQDG